MDCHQFSCSCSSPESTIIGFQVGNFSFEGVCFPGSGRPLDSDFTLPTIWIQWKVPKRLPFPLDNSSIFHCHVAKMKGAVRWNSTWIPLKGDAFSHTVFCNLWFVNCWWCWCIVYGCICLSCRAAQNCNIWCVLHTESPSFWKNIHGYTLWWCFRQWFHCHSQIVPLVTLCHRMIPLWWHEILGRIDWFCWEWPCSTSTFVGNMVCVFRCLLTPFSLGNGWLF